jgi:hypothetical protein
MKFVDTISEYRIDVTPIEAGSRCYRKEVL